MLVSYNLDSQVIPAFMDSIAYIDVFLAESAVDSAHIAAVQVYFGLPVDAAEMQELTGRMGPCFKGSTVPEI